ncbi:MULTISPECIES: DUF2336 domain-containing protein [unclassified Bradyrhizobium]|uniref:DUF2336 domain-containing protein n=1 Tax=unclassified Bradyrhizobium TaxID=2631580 RepID=UPI0024797B09|nr:MULTISPECIES: DUF2336 domain-containing protein [unclassified Bradyrhizobium]WGR74276.1 DUF2336 domain-containing protein [Bradyrhizobium sp. ISRA426]WGR79111.1 DUF2336 domain-containing protein [Bradyrhizobium sp. ISRA430]WGR89515.1 DUF2336 domain-containing protein [Bradyrhizobium sp. ISRA432]
MIVRQFISWIRTAPAGERAEATRALARAWLISDLSHDDRIAAEGALLMLLDDPSPLVRRAMAEAFARSAEAPAAIVRALSADQPSVALPVLEHSPLLIDADLVDIVATGNDEVQCAIARRIALPASVCAAIAEVGCAAAALELIENPCADLAPFSWDRIVERHGHLAAIREAMLVLEDLPAATRAALVAKLSETLAQFVVARNWISADRAGRMATEARDRSTMNIAARSRGEDMQGLVRHLRVTGQLTAGLILRALLSSNLELFDAALAELSDLPLARVSALLHDRRGSSLHALLRRAGLPEATFAAFHAALEACHENGFVDTDAGAVRLRRRMVERVLTHCATDRGATGPLLILLRRFATESAREEARLFCDELVADEAIAPIYDDPIAA